MTEVRAELWEEVQRLLRTKKWSPEQISRRLRRDHPDEPVHRHERRRDGRVHVEAGERHAQDRLDRRRGGAARSAVAAGCVG